ncbi:MAG TPA: hypothetical protein VN755_09830, partial [Steroidobacteraceae bacterium]|nr:hypothetical protein [Steroidobacteraceae bacterium]
IDASIGFFVTPSIVFGFTGSTAQQTFGDVTADDPNWGLSAPTSTAVGSLSQRGTGGKPVTARNNRGQLSAIFVF